MSHTARRRVPVGERKNNHRDVEQIGPLMRERGSKIFADWQPDRRFLSERREEKKRDLRSWVTLSCQCSFRLKWCWLFSEERDEQEGQSWAHSSPVCTTCSAVSQSLLGKGREDECLPSSHSNSCGDDAAHKWYYWPICKIHILFCFCSKMAGMYVTAASFSFRLNLKMVTDQNMWSKYSVNIP